MKNKRNMKFIWITLLYKWYLHTLIKLILLTSISGMIMLYSLSFEWLYKPWTQHANSTSTGVDMHMAFCKIIRVLRCRLKIKITTEICYICHFKINFNFKFTTNIDLGFYNEICLWSISMIVYYIHQI